MPSLSFSSFAILWGLLLLPNTVSGFALLPQKAQVTAKRAINDILQRSAKKSFELFVTTGNNNQQEDDNQELLLAVTSRRKMMLTSLGMFIGTAATATSAIAEAEENTIWLTGKAPKVPGQKPKDKNDPKGTRKDPNFLRSISDCKSQCENTPGPDGLAKSKEDCLSECQDICCTTYEQCTFAIVPRI